jgi:enoyl-CoA hydratase
MSQPHETILLDTDDQGIATVTVSRPKKLNALNTQVLDELADVFTAIRREQSITGVIITGAGDKAFVAGADIKELRELDETSGKEKSQKGQQVFQQIGDMRKPVVAAVNGYALGGGAELAMACHLRVAGTNAAFGLPEVGLGLIPGYGGTQRLSRIVGQARALELILTTTQIKAEKAHQWGLVNQIAEESPVEAARSLIQKMLKNGPLAIQHAIEAVYQSGTEAGFEKEAELFARLCETEDFVEGTSAFLEKRKPKFKGK